MGFAYVFMGVMLVSCLYCLYLIFEFIWNLMCGHKWNYRNPSDRTCVKCGQIENEYCDSMDDFYKPGRGWWEIHKNGEPGVCRHLGGNTRGVE